MKTGTFLSGLGLGLGAMFLLDGEQGKRRRTLVQDKATRYAKVTRETGTKTWKDLRNRTTGIAAEVRGRLRPGAVDPATLVDRVRSVMGRNVSNPRTIEVEATDGQIILSGPVLREEMDRLIAAVSRTRGVHEVVNRLDPRESAEAVPGFKPGGAPRPSVDIAQENWAPATRMLVGGGGGALLTWAVLRRDAMSPLVGLLGAGLLARSLTNRKLTRMLGRGKGGAVRVAKTVHIDAPVDQVYSFWANFENFPRFMEHLSHVTSLGGNLSRWVARGPAGVEVTWDAIATEFDRNRTIAWRSVEGSTVDTEGSVRFEEADGGTRVHVQLSYTPPAGVVGHGVAALFGSDPKTAMDEDLLRMKSMLESGETTSSGDEVFSTEPRHENLQ